MLEGIKNLTAADEAEFIAQNDCIIIFHKTLCPMCKVMGKVMAKVHEQDPSINIVSIDSELDAPLLEKYGAERVPTIVVIKNGEKKAIHVGVMKPHELVDFYAKA